MYLILFYKLNEWKSSSMELIYPKEFKAESNVWKSTDVRNTIFFPDTWKIKIFSLLLFA